ncbi:hypothetical protein E3N88_08039 [Mikania micrantha]|uniref:Uncharacterized protein n=1 Tax=Mikania micrantha TaxID=192012 RepID=A0A5N6PF84_9ASTR|nr:hypothetical protein E3N88_08039 [Mikania micrantha]
MNTDTHMMEEKDDEEKESTEEEEFEDKEDTSDDNSHEFLFIMSGSHDTRGHHGSCGRAPPLRDAPGTRKLAESSPAKRASGLRKYTCGRYTRWCKPVTRSHSDNRKSAGDGMGDTRGAQFYNQRLELIHDDEDGGYHSESDANTDSDNDNDTSHSTSQRDSNYGGVSPDIIQKGIDTLHATSHPDSNCEGRSRGTSQNLNGISCDTSQRNSVNGGESRGTSQRPSIARLGDKFASYDIHHTICTIMREHLTKPWITFRMVPKDVRRDMYNCFKTRWSTNLECEQSNFEAFINVLKDRYSDMMYNLKLTSTRIARNDGCDIAIDDYKQFKIIRQYPPDSIPIDVWAKMCDLWDSDAWRKKSRIAKSNRDKGNDKAARHTGGSIGYAEYRARMASYLEEMIEKNGLEFSVDDPEIHDLEVQMEVERRSRQELEEEIRKERQERQELQQQMKEFMKKCMERPSS